MHGILCKTIIFRTLRFDRHAFDRLAGFYVEQTDLTLADGAKPSQIASRHEVIVFFVWLVPAVTPVVSRLAATRLIRVGTC